MAVNPLFLVMANLNLTWAIKASRHLLLSATFPTTVGAKEDKLGIRASSTTELLEDCEVPIENRLGDEGIGIRLPSKRLMKVGLESARRCWDLLKVHSIMR